MRATFIGFSALFLSVAAPAAAEALTVRIPVAPADLQSGAAIAALYDRVVAAADTVCRRANRSASWLDQSIASCRRDTIRRAIADADITPLTQRHHEVVARRPAPPVLASR